MSKASAASHDDEPELFWDSLLRDSKGRVVAPPELMSGGEVSVADTHAHLDMLSAPALALARSKAHHVDFVVTVVDPTEDALFTYDHLAEWLKQARELLEQWQRGAEASHETPPRLLADASHENPPRLLADASLGIPYEISHETPPKALPEFPPKAPLEPPHVRVIVGCHPHNAAKFSREAAQQLISAAARPETAGIGEIGLDYHYDHSPRAVQREVFRQQLALAQKMQLPIALHLREAHEDGLAILQKEGIGEAGVLLHCFNLDYATLEPFLALGCTVAFGGAVTFKKSDVVRAAAAATPPKRIVTETDAPFMAPHPLRGTTCEPAQVVFTAACLAETFGATGSEAQALLTTFSGTARALFDRAPTAWQSNSSAVQTTLKHAKGVV